MKKLLLSLLLFFCTPLAFAQFFEGFENTTGITGPLPATWSLNSGNWAVFDNNVGPMQSWGINSFATGLQHMGTNCASVSRENIGIGNTSEDFLATPALSIPTGTVTQLHFYNRQFTAGDQGTLYRVMIAPAIDPSFQTNPGAYTTVQQWNEGGLNSSPSTWEEKIVDLSAYAGFDVYIAFVRVYIQSDLALSGDRWLLDDVGLFSGAGSCFVNAYANYISPTEIDLSWNTTSTAPIEVMILPCDQPAPASTDSGVVVNDNIYHFTNLIPGTCYRTYIKNPCSGAWQMVSVSYDYGPIRLIAFIDSNSNGIMDTGEGIFQHGTFSINGNLTSWYSYNHSGSYNFIPNHISDTFDFGFQIDSFNASCFSLSPVTYDNIEPSQQTQTLYFPIVPTLSCFDNKVILSQGSLPRPGINDYDYLQIITNSISAPSTGTLTYTKAPETSIVSVMAPTGVVLTPTGFTYDYSGLTLNNPLHLTIVNSIPPIPTVAFGQVLSSSASISFTPADIDASNDSCLLTQTIRASYDPNDINESHGPKIQFDQFNQNDYLYYTIRFQNTGNANAIRVFVNDLLDSQIDPSSIEMVAASHNYIMARSGNNISWEFNNIQLPPASENEPLSNGFITYRVKLNPGFAIGDIIPNTASIYFDSNPAIVTNTFNTEFVETLGNASFASNTVALFPNPASDIVTITNNSLEKITKVNIYDVTGKRIYAIDNAPENISIDVSRFAKGIYLMELTFDNNSKITKKLILK